MKLLKYVWLLLAIAAFIGVCRGATHHLLTFGLSALMCWALWKTDKEEEKRRTS